MKPHDEIHWLAGCLTEMTCRVDDDTESNVDAATELYEMGVGKREEVAVPQGVNVLPKGWIAMSVYADPRRRIGYTEFYHYKTREDTEREALRLAKLDGKPYVVLEVVAVAEVADPVLVTVDGDRTPLIAQRMRSGSLA